MINIHPMKYMIEIQNTTNPEGINCLEGIEVEIRDDGGGPYLALTPRNLEPSEDYGAHTISLERKDIVPLCEVLTKIAEDAVG